MKSWSISAARSNISDLFNAALASGPQKIERRDSEPVIGVAESAWIRLVAAYDTFSDSVLNMLIERDDLPQRRPDSC